MDQPAQERINTSPSLTPPPQPKQQRPPYHRRNGKKTDDECDALYHAMQICALNANRNWLACQKEVQALKECIVRRKKEKEMKSLQGGYF